MDNHALFPSGICFPKVTGKLKNFDRRLRWSREPILQSLLPDRAGPCLFFRAS